MKLFTRLLTITVIMSISSLAFSANNTMILTNASSCHITDAGNKLGKGVALYSYTFADPNDTNSPIEQYASLNPQGEAPFLPAEHPRGVWIGEAGKTNLTFNENDGSDSIIVTDISKEDGCSASSPCYVTTNSNPCLDNTQFKIGHTKLKL